MEPLEKFLAIFLEKLAVELSVKFSVELQEISSMEVPMELLMEFQ